MHGEDGFPREEAGRGGKVTYITQADILDQSGIDLGFGEHLLQQRVDEEIEFCVLEAALDGLGEGSAQSKRNDNIIGILLGAARATSEL